MGFIIFYPESTLMAEVYSNDAWAREQGCAVVGVTITLVDPVGYSCLAPLTSLLTHCARAMAV